MVAGLLVSLSLCGYLVYCGILPIYIFAGILFVIYWLPKCITVKFLNKIYPNILTHNKNTNKKQISLTFDDVPYNGTSSFTKIVQILDNYGMKGTFFIISGDVDDNSRKLLVDVVKNGHQLGNHGKRNTMHFCLSESSLIDEIEDCDKLITSIYNEVGISFSSSIINKKIYRPGCGLFHNKMLEICDARNYKLTLGSVYPDDPLVCCPIINYYYLLSHIENGDIVILHDRKWTPQMLERLLKHMKSIEMESVTVDNLFHD